MRGIGKTKLKENINKKIWSWQTLTDDHIFIFEQLKNKMQGTWILAGHSLGAWLSLLSSEKLNITRVWLFDPPILMPQVVLKWLTAIALNKKRIERQFVFWKVDGATMHVALKKYLALVVVFHVLPEISSVPHLLDRAAEVACIDPCTGKDLLQDDFIHAACWQQNIKRSL